MIVEDDQRVTALSPLTIPRSAVASSPTIYRSLASFLAKVNINRCRWSLAGASGGSLAYESNGAKSVIVAPLNIDSPQADSLSCLHSEYEVPGAVGWVLSKI